MKNRYIVCILLGLLTIGSFAQEDEDETLSVDEDIAKSKVGSKTDDETVEREAEAIKLDGLSVAQMKEIRESGEKKHFQAEVSRMMNLIINSLYRNKEIFLRELISNASDALDKVRLLSLTDPSALDATAELSIKIKLDKDNNMLHITDTGVGMSKAELEKNLGTIAKSGTSDFYEKMQQSSGDQASDLIGQFGVGFYSSFLVADSVIVASKSNEDATQHIWTSDSGSFSISEDPRGDTLKRGTTISLIMKEESAEYLQMHTIKDLINKYSQFINFPIYIWESKEEESEEPLSEEEDAERLEKLDAMKAKKEKAESAADDEDEDVSVEEDDIVLDEDIEELEKTTKTTKSTVWDWRQVNENKPIWLKKQSEVEEEEYEKFYKAISKDHDGPMCKTHFVAEGEVTFRSLLYIPKALPSGMFQDYGKKTDQIKMYVRRVFISDDFTDMMPKYLSFVRGVVDSDDLPLNVSRETLQQHKLLKVIKKKLVRKVLDMIKKLDDEEFKKFWTEYGTNIKLGVMEDNSNRSRISKLLRFYSSNSDEDLTSLEDYVERMKDKQETIFFVSGTSRSDLEKSPFVEKILKDGYEVLYLIDPVDEYTMQSLPEFDGKRFQNVAKDGLELPESEKKKEHWKEVEEEMKPLTDFLKTKLEDVVDKVQISKRLDKTPCVLVSSKYGWSANMERIMKSQAYQKAQDPSRMHQLSQKKTLEINPRHPLIKKLNDVREDDEEQATDLAKLIYKTARVASGYSLDDPTTFVDAIYGMLSKNLGIENEEIEEDTFVDEEDEEEVAEDEEEFDAEDDVEAGEEEEGYDVGKDEL